jgi:hypothetical protein
MCATVCPSGALAFATIAEIMQARRGHPVNDWQFGDARVRTKVYVLVPTDISRVDVPIIPLSALRSALKPPVDSYDVAALLDGR